MLEPHPVEAQPDSDIPAAPIDVSPRASAPTWKATRALIRADVRRRLELEGKAVTFLNALAIALMPGVVTVVAYRSANYLHFRGGRLLPLLIADLLQLYTRNEVHVGSTIGPGWVLGDCPGVGLPSFCTIGRNCTMLGTVTLTVQGEDVDFTTSRIVLGDNCVIGNAVRIIGSVTLADGTQIKPNTVVLRSSLLPGAILDGVPARRKSVVPLAELVAWNPLRSRPVGAS